MNRDPIEPRNCHCKVDVHTLAYFDNQRQALLLAVDGIERYRGITPLTSECRQMAKAAALLEKVVLRRQGEDWHQWAMRVRGFLVDGADQRNPGA